MGITNDMILYGGEVYLEVECRSDDEIIDALETAPSSASRDYGKPFYEIFVEAGKDFYKIDPGLFAPAKITITNRRTGKTYTAGYVNPEILKRSIALIPK
jgi:methenyltetrahydromethanopterin cyclohydrolase